MIVINIIIIIVSYLLYSAERLAKSMKLKNMVELNNLEMAEQGYGDMSLYLIWEKAGYRLLIRDVKRCQDFVSVFKGWYIVYVCYISCVG